MRTISWDIRTTQTGLFYALHFNLVTEQNLIVAISYNLFHKKSLALFYYDK